VAVVTGAASGIGRATSLALARKGCDLALVDLSEPGMAETAEGVRQAGRRVTVHRADVSSREEMGGLPERVVAEHGRVHVLVNNAGVGHSGSFEETPADDFDWVMGINFGGVVNGCRSFLPVLRAQDEAHIVNLSSMLAFWGLPSQVGYCASKAAVRSFSETLAAELAGTGIGVTSVHPGAVATDIVRASRYVDESAKEPMATRVARFAIPPERVANRIVGAIERRRLRVRVGPDAVALDLAKRLLPVGLVRASGWAYRRFGAFA
jgi:NAD(P)-dependent dehydrogenase (short-subunit alcohol dehydrogenase family)